MVVVDTAAKRACARVAIQAVDGEVHNSKNKGALQRLGPRCWRKCMHNIWLLRVV